MKKTKNLVIGTATAVGGALAGTTPALADNAITTTDSDTALARVQVNSTLMLTMEDDEFLLTGVEGDTPSETGAVKYNVRTNNRTGYSVTVQAASDKLVGKTAGNTDTIDTSALKVRETGTSTWKDSSASAPVGLHSQDHRSSGYRGTHSGDEISDDYKITIPFVKSDEYQVTLNYVASIEGSGGGGNTGGGGTGGGGDGSTDPDPISANTLFTPARSTVFTDSNHLLTLNLATGGRSFFDLTTGVDKPVTFSDPTFNPSAWSADGRFQAGSGYTEGPESTPELPIYIPTDIQVIDTTTGAVKYSTANVVAEGQRSPAVLSGNGRFLMTHNGGYQGYERHDTQTGAVLNIADPANSGPGYSSALWVGNDGSWIDYGAVWDQSAPTATLVKTAYLHAPDGSVSKTFTFESPEFMGISVSGDGSTVVGMDNYGGKAETFNVSTGAHKLNTFTGSMVLWSLSPNGKYFLGLNVGTATASGIDSVTVYSTGSEPPRTLSVGDFEGATDWAGYSWGVGSDGKVISAVSLPDGSTANVRK